MQVQTCLQFLCNLFGLHPHSPSLLPAPPLPRPFTLSFHLPSLSRARSGRRQRRERLAAVSGSPGAGCRAAGSRAALVTEYNKPGRLLAGGRSAAASPGALAHPLTPAPSCSAALPSLCNRVLLPAAPWGFRPPLPSSPSPTPPAPKLLSRGSSGDRLSPLGRHAPRRPHAPRGARGCAGPRKSRGRGPEAPSLACLTSWRCTASSASPRQRSRCRDPPSGRAFPPGPPGGGQGGKKWPEAPARGCAALPANFCLGFHRSVTFRSRTCLERLGKCPDGPRKEMMQFNEDIPLGSF